MVHRRTNWTREEDRTVAELFWKGFTDKEIAARLENRTPGAVQGRRRILLLTGIPRSHRWVDPWSID